jgi:predicted GIY-YIG superfamily endonuclease
MTNRPNGVLYTGVTSDIARRAYEHQKHRIGFSKPSRKDTIEASFRLIATAILPAAANCRGGFGPQYAHAN